MSHIKIWVITVERENGWGADYVLPYLNGDNAMAKFNELVNKHNLDIVGLLGNCAIAGDSRKHNHVVQVTIEPMFTCD